MKRIPLLLLLFGISTVMNSSVIAQVTIAVAPDNPLMDDTVEIEIGGLMAGQRVTLLASTRFSGQHWSSRTSWVTGETGTIGTGRDEPVEASYSGVDAMGWLWSMQAADARTSEDASLSLSDPRPIDLQVEIDGMVVAEKQLARWLMRPEVRVRDVGENGLVGKLFEPAESGRHPAILVLSGSEGGVPDSHAALLASRGYTALALAYFNAGDLPKQLVNIRLEYLRDGLQWLAKQDSVDPDRIGVIGASKGGELALLLGARFPQIRTVVAGVPSHVAWSGIGGTFTEPSWTWQGEAVPYVRTRPNAELFREMRSGSAALISLYRGGLEDETAVRAATIPVENINGAVLVVSGSDDQLWPSSEMAEHVVARLREHDHPHPFEHLKYDGAGHAILGVWIPLANTVTAGNLKLGGSPEANARAIADSRPRVLEFLEQNLRGLKEADQ